MSKILNITDNQELPASDLMVMQRNHQDHVDKLVKDAIDQAKKFAGFAITVVGTTGLTVGDGRIYQAGLDYSRPADTGTTFSLATGSVSLPVVAKKIISLVGWGTEQNGVVQPREFETAVTDTNGTYTGEYTVESRDVATAILRFANIDLISGVESANPSPPTVGSQYVEIARILCDSNGVVTNGITYVEANRMKTVAGIDGRTTTIEEQLLAFGAAVNSLVGDIAAINSVLGNVPRQEIVTQVIRDVARLKETVQRPDTATAYGAITFGTTNEVDLTHSQSLCRVDGLLTFPDAAIKEAIIGFTNPNEPLVVKKGNITLPVHTEVVVIDTMTGLIA
jgi:hypothetical protein